ncbi:hypothetical protein EJ05DRAFT_384585 [Pseudovirgaria hyperparasitica]|uniref:Uncharacterized protein n=1 Tax=Pseudovirgaria hyperparasitica TaxID=470096 RepID=A0A6A6VRJ6_9PEZI|nr:uncharacterized protein EJ05DRAFT_384585 [Pseudovirgaria hyperparasitica]KAF2752384.1 hypothetical protein EJ05DRAFT_384585 [Pseudovirgaria hyperparasitica]
MRLPLSLRMGYKSLQTENDEFYVPIDTSVIGESCDPRVVVSFRKKQIHELYRYEPEAVHVRSYQVGGDVLVFHEFSLPKGMTIMATNLPLPFRRSLYGSHFGRASISFDTKADGSSIE